MSFQTVQNILATADIKIGGKRAWDIQVHNPKFYDRLLADGSLGAGESYVEGWWDCRQLDAMVARVLKARANQHFHSWREIFDTARAILFNPQLKYSAFYNAQKHYDIDHTLYEKMLGRRMIYSCGYWHGAKTLDQAQTHKLELIFKKLGLKPGMKLLDIGCGWGGLAEYAAKKHRVQVVGVTVSKDQHRYAKKVCRGLPVEIRMQDYRDLKGSFDRIVSVGMFEHVGYHNYLEFMRVAARCLKDDGLFLLHTIGNNQSETKIDPWVQRHIFPNAMLPSITQIGAAIEGLFIMEDWHSFGPDYDKTLMAWFANFDRAWKQLKGRYGERFYRMWKYYLLSCAGAFRARDIQLWQILLSKGGKSVHRVR